MVLYAVNTYQLLILHKLVLRTVEIIALVWVINVYLAVLLVEETYPLDEKLALTNSLNASHRSLRINKKRFLVFVISSELFEKW